LDSALQTWQQLLRLYQSEGNLQGEGNILNNLGIAYRGLGQYATAIAHYEQALTIQANLQNLQGQGQILGNLGNAYALIGRYALAENYQRQSLEISQTLNSSRREAISLANLGSIYLDQGRYEDAIEHYELAQDILERLDDQATVAVILNNLASIFHIQAQDYDQAIAYYQDSLDLAILVGDRQLEAESLSGLGFVYESLGEYSRALQYYDQSLVIFNDIQAKESAALALNNRAHALLNWGKELSDEAGSLAKFKAAESNLEQAISILDSVLGDVLNDTDKISLFDTQTRTYNLLQQVLVIQGKHERALEVAEQGRARALVSIVSEQKILSSEQFSLEHLKTIARRHNSTLVEYTLIPDDGFIHQGKLQGNTAEILIWVISPNGNVDFRSVSLQGQNLAQLVRHNLNVTGGRDRGFALDLETETELEQLTQLHELLIEPIADLLPTDSEQRVTFIPQGELFLVPFPALTDADGTYLIEKYAILTAPSIQFLSVALERREALLQTNQPATQELLVIGNPEMPNIWDSYISYTEGAGQLSPLPGAEQEALEIAALFGVDALIGHGASENLFKQQAGNAQIIHLATHGLLEYGNPVDSGVRDIPGAIALAPGQGQDGLLTSAEILDELTLKADLVVLSACDTGRGDITGDGVVGLARSLIAAGTPSVVVSLWAVPDVPTAQLMIRFYEELNRGQDKAQALRQAMLATMERYPEPKDWAAFTLIGDIQ
jgi:CHAT domain-containing protein